MSIDSIIPPSQLSFKANRVLVGFRPGHETWADAIINNLLQAKLTEEISPVVAFNGRPTFGYAPLPNTTTEQHFNAMLLGEPVKPSPTIWETPSLPPRFSKQAPACATWFSPM